MHFFKDLIFDQLSALYQYVFRACCSIDNHNCKIYSSLVFIKHLMCDLVIFFSHSSNSCFIFCRNLYTHFVHEMIVEPGTKASAGSQADDHVSLLLPQNHAILFKGGGVRINVIFWITYTHVFTGLTTQKCLHLLLQFLDLKCFTFDL